LQHLITSLAVLGLVLSASVSVQAEDASRSETQAASVTLEDFRPTLGRWQVTNWLMIGPGQMEERHFSIHVAADLGGKGLRTDWFMQDGRYFGTVLQTLHVGGQGLDQLYYSAAEDSWAISEQYPVLRENGFGTQFEG